MKKIFFALAIALMATVSCGKQNTEPEPEPEKEATYAFMVADRVFQKISQEYGPITTNIYLTEYKGRQRVGQNHIVNPETGDRKYFTAQKVAEYVTVYITVERYDGVTAKSYIANAFYLTPGVPVYINLEESTATSSKEPIAD